MATFDLLAAIDLRGGQVVRLRQGDFDRETAYGRDAVGVATAFASRGVRWLHVVDLDGARAGEGRHGDLIRRLIAAVGTGVAVEVAGGLRTLEACATALSAGARRVVVGSAALADPGFAAALIEAHGAERVAVALDVRDGVAVGGAWQRDAPGTPVESAVDDLVEAGVRWFEVTAIDRDGAMAGPDLELLARAVERAAPAAVIASGGITSVEDLVATWTLGCRGAIVGRALYEGDFDLERALRATGRSPSGPTGG